ncbi:MAG: hypothetical protein Q9183_005588 [Haloplaca sp. 2 TL-2023]
MYYPRSPSYNDRTLGQDARRALQDRRQHAHWYGTHHHDRTLPAPTTDYSHHLVPLKYPERSYDPHTRNRDPYPADLDEDMPATSTYHPKENSPEALQEQLYGITDFNPLLRIWNRVHRFMDAEKDSETRQEYRRVSERCEYKCRTIINQADTSEFVRILKIYCNKETISREVPRLLQERLKKPDAMRELLGRESFRRLLGSGKTARVLAFLFSLGYLHEDHVDEVVRREYG